MATMQHLATSSHWYTQKGEPFYEIKSANGNMRPPDIRDARKYSLVPSVTSYSKLLDKPALTNWIVNGVLEVAVKTPRGDAETDAEWIRKVSDLAQAERSKPAERGTAIHAHVETFLTTKQLPEADEVAKRACEQIGIWLEAKGVFDVKSEVCGVNLREGVAGKTDLILDGKEIWDVKTTKNVPKSPWPEWKIQLAGYYLVHDLAIQNSGILAIDSSTGALTPFNIPAADIIEAHETFQLIMALWRRLKGYDPRRK